MSEGTTRKVNKLHFADKFRVAEWLRARWPEIESSRPTQRAVAEAITADLGLPFSACSVGALCRDLNLAWPNGHAGRDKPADDRLAAIEEDLRDHCDAIAGLAARVTKREAIALNLQRQVERLAESALDLTRLTRDLEDRVKKLESEAEAFALES